MKAMILAAGLGKRLRPLTENCPKPLLPVGGTPLIVWNLLLLRQYGLRDVMINLHYLGHRIQETLGDGTAWGMHITYSLEGEILGTGGGLKRAEWFFEKKPFLVLNGDILIDLNLTHLIEHHARSGGIATMVLRDDPEVERWGVVETDRQDRVVTINGHGWSGERGKPETLRRMFAGVHVIHPKLLCYETMEASSIIDAYVTALEQGALVAGYLCHGYWSDVGTPERYAHVQRDVAAGRISLPL